MWSSRLLWKLFASYALLYLLATVTLVTIVVDSQQDELIDQITSRLRSSATLVRKSVSGELPGGRTQQLQDRIRSIAEAIDTRVTLVAMNGDVLADSRFETVSQVAAMENHRNRRELIQAAEHGFGMSQRESPTLGVPMLYVALRAEQNGEPIGLVRAALPMKEVRAQVAELPRQVWLVALLMGLVVVGITVFVARRVVFPVSQLTAAAQAIAAGDYHHRIYIASKDELGTLGRSFNVMSSGLAARESQLRESRQRLETVLEGMAEGVIALDESEHIVLANAAAGRLLGIEPGDAEGRPLLEVVRNHEMHEALSEHQSESGAWRVEIALRDEESRVVSINATMISGEPSTRCILVLQDVTELRRLESLRQEFVANVSHELKTPLGSIKAYAETLLNGAIDDDQNNVRFVERIAEQAERLHELILDMLSLARIEAGKMAFDIANVPLEEIVATCFRERQALAESNGIQLETIDDASHLAVRADEEGLREILNNLVDNAIKYTPEGGTVSVAWRVEDTMAVIEVRDTGIGIPSEHLPRVFERFYRVDKARARELGGTGLGLAIVKHLAQSFGGGVAVVSQPGKGSVFAVRIPRA